MIHDISHVDGLHHTHVITVGLSFLAEQPFRTPRSCSNVCLSSAHPSNDVRSSAHRAEINLHCFARLLSFVYLNYCELEQLERTWSETPARPAVTK